MRKRCFQFDGMDSNRPKETLIEMYRCEKWLRCEEPGWNGASKADSSTQRCNAKLSICDTLVGVLAEIPPFVDESKKDAGLLDISHSEQRLFIAWMVRLQCKENAERVKSGPAEAQDGRRCQCPQTTFEESMVGNRFRREEWSTWRHTQISSRLQQSLPFPDTSCR